MKHLTILCAALFLVVLALVGCAASSTQGPTAWLDEPLDGAALPLEPTEIMAHASDADGVTSLEFYVNGALLVRSPAEGGMLADATVGWNPSRSGVYTIAARATDSQGNVGPYAEAEVTVGTVQASPTPRPTGQPTEEVVTQATPTPRTPSSPGPTMTPRVPTATPRQPTATSIPATRTPLPPTATPQPPARRAEIAYFEANPSTINAGGCSTIRWGVDYAAAVYLDGEGVFDHDERQVCPATTTTYTLQATSGGGDDTRSVEVTVIQAPTPTPIVTAIVVDTDPPYVSDLEADPDSIMETGWQCTGGQTTVSVFADDPSGVAGVRAYWSIESQSGQVNMTSYGGGVYEAVLGPFDINAAPAILTISFVAWDTVHNTTYHVGPITVVVTSCIG